VQRLISGTSYTDAISHLNGLGLADRSFVCNGSYGTCTGSTDWDTVDTVFNGLGLPVYTSNPYAGSGISSAKATSTGAEPGDVFSYDALARRTQVAEPPVVAGQSPVVSFNYASGGTVATVLATDEAGRQRAWLSNALGQLAEVREYHAPGAYYATDYAYNGAGALTSVTQGVQTRTFSYNELGELLSAANPESGTTYYTYDLNANLVQETEANGTVVSATFDALNRLRTRSFTVAGATAPTGTASFDYDTDSTGETVYGAIGQLTRVAVAGSPVALSLNQYDEMGRLQVLDTIVNGTTYHSSVYYDQIGFPTYEHFPSGRAIYLTDDLEGRSDWIGDSGGGTYVHQRYYEPYGTIEGEDLGNGLTQGWHHNDRMQVTEVDTYPTGAYNWSTQRMDIALGYTSAAQPMDNGNLLSLTDNMGEAAQNQSYSYDPLNRISGWSTGGGTNCSYTLDQYGNLTAAAGSGCPLLPKTVNAANNQIVGYGFDANGNFLSDTAGTTATFDGNNQLVGFNTPGQNAQYLYDGLLHRVQKTANSVSTLYFRNALGQVVSELSGGQWTDYINSAEGDRIAVINAGGTYYVHADPLGTVRAITDSSGNNILNCAQNPNYTQGSMLTYAPFGQEVSGCTQSLLNYKFTGQERDAESGWDYFQARSYASNLGRFLSPDPGGAGANSISPQTWNRYGYVGNSPLIAVDLFGLSPCGTASLRGDTDPANSAGSFGPNDAGDETGTEPQEDCLGGHPAQCKLDYVDIDCGLGLMLGTGGDGIGGPGGGGSPASDIYSCPWYACEPTIPGHDGEPYVPGTTITLVDHPGPPVLDPKTGAWGNSGHWSQEAVWTSSGAAAPACGSDIFCYFLTAGSAGNQVLAPGAIGPTPLMAVSASFDSVRSSVVVAARWYCGASAAQRILRSTRNGAAVGAVTGGIVGFVSGEALGGEVSLGATGVPGAALGAIIGASLGATRGVEFGAIGAAACGALGLYN